MIGGASSRTRLTTASISAAIGSGSSAARSRSRSPERLASGEDASADPGAVDGRAHGSAGVGGGLARRRAHRIDRVASSARIAAGPTRATASMDTWTLACPARFACSVNWACRCAGPSSASISSS